jgi:hypothetical protein
VKGKTGSLHAERTSLLRRGSLLLFRSLLKLGPDAWPTPSDMMLEGLDVTQEA